MAIPCSDGYLEDEFQKAKNFDALKKLNTMKESINYSNAPNVKLQDMQKEVFKKLFAAQIGLNADQIKHIMEQILISEFATNLNISKTSKFLTAALSEDEFCFALILIGAFLQSENLL